MNSPSKLDQEIKFVTSADGTRIATATMGRGGAVVRAAHWLTHVSRDPDSPIWRHWISELSRRNRLIRYDLRGCGLSQRDVADISFEAWLADLEAVTDTLDEPFTLIGMSQGGALSIAYAVRYPEKVERLILIGAYAQGILQRAQDDDSKLEAETLSSLIRLGWGRDHNVFNQVFTNLFIPEGSSEQRSWWQNLERETTSADTAARTFDVLQRIDVLSMASKLKVPTMVMHARNDARIPFSEGQRLASTIPGAQFVPLESANHVLLEEEPEWETLTSALEAFLPTSALPSPTLVGVNLTSAEREVLDLISLGLGNGEIAAELGKSEKTVRNQVSMLFDKTGVKTRAELIVRVLSAT